MCYNRTVKRIFVLLSLFLIGISAQGQEITVLPVPVAATNAYGFESTSEIIAKSVASADKNYIVETPQNGLVLRNVLSNKNKSVNPKLLKAYSKNDKILVIMSYITDNNGKMFDVWDILKVSTDFDINKSYKMEVKAILTDNNDGVVLWQDKYEQPLGTFKAINMTEAVDKREKITSYAKNIIAQDITQNINLRLNPKHIDYTSRVQQTEGSQEGIGLKYKNSIPITKITQPPDDDFEQRWRYDDSFSY